MLVTGAFQSGMSIVNDLNSGFLQKVLLTPASRSAILLGRLMNDLLVLMVQSAIIIGVAMLMGLSIATGVRWTVAYFRDSCFLRTCLVGALTCRGLEDKKGRNSYQPWAIFWSFHLSSLAALSSPHRSCLFGREPFLTTTH